MILLFIYIILSITFFTISLLLFSAFIRKNQFNFNISLSLSFSIIVPFKNEEINLPALINSLAKLNYDADKYEIIFVDDNSEDSGSKIVAEFASNNKTIRLLSAKDKKYPGKKGALQIGIDSANNEYIITTDADCQIPHEWLNEYNKIFSTGSDIVFGLVKFSQENTFINKLTRFESLRKILLTFGSASMGLPFSAGGANFGFRKQVFETIGGYENTLQTLSGDDDLLIQEAVKNKLRIAPIKNLSAAITTDSVNTLIQYLNQKARHTSTSHSYLLRNQIFLGLWHGINISLLLSPIFMFINLLFIYPFIFKLLIDFIFLSKTNKKIDYKFKFYDFFFLQIIYELLLPINYFNSMFSKIRWK